MCGAHTFISDKLPEELPRRMFFGPCSFAVRSLWRIPSRAEFCEDLARLIPPGSDARYCSETRNFPRVEHSLFIKLVGLLQAKSGTSLQRLIHDLGRRHQHVRFQVRETKARGYSMCGATGCTSLRPACLQRNTAHCSTSVTSNIIDWPTRTSTRSVSVSAPCG